MNFNTGQVQQLRPYLTLAFLSRLPLKDHRSMPCFQLSYTPSKRLTCK
jgi:hypothetical protein